MTVKIKHIIKHLGTTTAGITVIGVYFKNRTSMPPVGASVDFEDQMLSVQDVVFSVIII